MFGRVGLPFNIRVKYSNIIKSFWVSGALESQTFKMDAWDLSQRSHRTYNVYFCYFDLIPKSCRLNSIGETPGPISRTSIDLMKRVIPALLASKLMTSNPSNISVDQQNISD